MKTSVLFTATILSVLSLTNGKSSASHFCGRRLANALAVVCAYDEEAVKRSDNSIEDKDWDFRGLFEDQRLRRSVSSSVEDTIAPVESENPIEDSVYSNGDRLDSVQDRDWKLRSMLQGGRHKRGIIAECCEQPCTLNELATYC